MVFTCHHKMQLVTKENGGSHLFLQYTNNQISVMRWELARKQGGAEDVADCGRLYEMICQHYVVQESAVQKEQCIFYFEIVFFVCFMKFPPSLVPKICRKVQVGVIRTDRC